MSKNTHFLPYEDLYCVGCTIKTHEKSKVLTLTKNGKKPLKIPNNSDDSFLSPYDFMFTLLSIQMDIQYLMGSVHRRRIDTESKANSRCFCLGGKIICRTGDFVLNVQYPEARFMNRSWG